MLKKFFEEQSAAQSGDIESDRQGCSSVAGCPVGRQSTPKQSFVNILEWCPDPTDQSVLKESACIYVFWKMIFLFRIITWLWKRVLHLVWALYYVYTSHWGDYEHG